MIKIFIFVAGSAIGSFLNVCIHRLPRGESVIKPRSYCPKCKKEILWYDNLPLLSYIFLKGRCRFCKEKISFRYFLVEFITALVFLIFYNLYGLGFNFVVYTLFVCALIIATFVDIAHRIIPDQVSLGGILTGFLFSIGRSLLQPGAFHFDRSVINLIFNPPPVLDSFLGILFGGGIIYFTGKGFDLIYFKLLRKPAIEGETESMGGGDVKFLAMIGAFLGWQRALFVFFLAPFFGAAVGVFNLLKKKQHTIPYGPFLAIAAVVSLFWMERVLRLIWWVR